jgi:hypothetical protein
VVVDDFDSVGRAILPDKANAPLIIDANAVLTNSVARKRFQAIAWRGSQIAQLNCRLDHPQLAPGCIFTGMEPSYSLAGSERKRVFVTV